MTVLAAYRWPTNAHLIEDVARLGYVRPEDLVVDATYGRGLFWRRWRPARLVAHDLDGRKGDGVDLRHLPEADGAVDVVVLVVSGHVRFLTIDLANHADAVGLELVDRFDMLGGGRPQPAGRRQVHAHGRPSTLLIFRKASAA